METGYPAPLTTEFTLPCGRIWGCTHWHDCGGRTANMGFSRRVQWVERLLASVCRSDRSPGSYTVILKSHTPCSQIYTPSTPASWDSTSSKLEIARLGYVYGQTTAPNYTRGFMVQPGFTASKLRAHWLKDLSLKWSFSVEVWEVAWKISEILWLFNILL